MNSSLLKGRYDKMPSKPNLRGYITAVIGDSLQADGIIIHCGVEPNEEMFLRIRNLFISNKPLF